MTEQVNVYEAKPHPSRLRGKIWSAPDFDETDGELIDACYDGPVFPDEQDGR